MIYKKYKNYVVKFSYSDIKQNSPNILPTVKRFKLLRLGAPNRNRTCTEPPRIEPEIKEDKKPIKPGDIIGKIDVHDTRERRDGPGGN